MKEKTYHLISILIEYEREYLWEVKTLNLSSIVLSVVEVLIVHTPPSSDTCAEFSKIVHVCVWEGRGAEISFFFWQNAVDFLDIISIRFYR